jgi:hypothetical protein
MPLDPLGAHATVLGPASTRVAGDGPVALHLQAASAREGAFGAARIHCATCLAAVLAARNACMAAAAAAIRDLRCGSARGRPRAKLAA